MTGEGQRGTLPKTNSSPLKIGHPKRKQSYSNHPFSGAFVVSFREGTLLGTNISRNPRYVLKMIFLFEKGVKTRVTELKLQIHSIPLLVGQVGYVFLVPWRVSRNHRGN